MGFDKRILNSHKRSKEYGINIDSKSSNKTLNNDELQNVLKENSELISIAKVYMDMFNDVLKNEEFIIVLTDKDGCVLRVTGKENTVKEYEKLNIKIGMYMDEKNIGTNAMAVALEEDRAVQITAEEHYINIFKRLTCSAAPIHGKNGDIIGTLNLTSEWMNKHPHSLGLVIFCVKAIEKELEKRQINNILKEAYNYVGSVMDNVDKGIITVDSDGKINNVNNLACEILNILGEDLIDEKIETIIPGWKNIALSFEKDNYKTYIKEIKLLSDTNNRTLITVKPIKLNEKVVGAVVTLSKKTEIQDNVYTSRSAYKTFDDILGESDAILNVITNCKIIANSPSTVLIQGESGTGKEILAQAIHNFSYRRDKKFVAINCGAIPKNLIESELFGYEEGAFTGAKKGGKLGKFEVANGGTVFLDEIGEMPLEMQVHLLRVIQEGRITRIGSEKEIPIDVRIIAATNKDLKEEIKNGTFREDLFYRLSVIPIYLPPLRERKGDVEKLIEHFLRIKAFKLNKNVPKIDENLYNKLINYSWPGNVRELENCIENIVNLDGKISYQFEDEKKEKNIKEAIDSHKECEVNDEDDSGIYIEIGDDFKIKDIEKILIEKAIKHNQYNMSRTARSLGISRNTLYYKLDKYNIY
ncbi:signal-transduction and transcriptional-control protein Stc [Clostridium baratii]|uniref:sigma-54-dependent Fis family transcriptional regulator n=1 Tax=Clostridium baratii TaxID=1561 RepID=UPI0006C55F42|nr:sigma 54-interacting transcriptional regulator [Clostridium baratii]MDU1054428.1 sigma 54-interacting transcriptional regulator [Clostridium baratii]CUP60611.1 signal-transduction and transcriptional-control protein Stc [Clostridium baratii]